MSQIEFVKVKEGDDGIRLDRWFKKYYPQANHIMVQKLCRKGQIRIGGKRVKPNDRIEMGQEIKVPMAIVTAYQVKPDKKKPAKLTDKERAFIKSLVLYEDAHVIAINKPHGLATQGGSKQKDFIDKYLDAFTNKQGERAKLVHRLDKDTSGVLLLARSAKAAKKLGDAFKSHDVRKYYWALTRPAPEMNEGVIKAPLAKGKGRGGERMMRDDEKGKKAVTYYSVMERMGKRAAWVAFWPRTGRTHQIRVHAALMHTPILGDFKYGIGEFKYGEDLAKWEGEEGAVDEKLHLHARRIIIPHPFDKRILDITAPLPEHMAKTWRYFNLNAKDKTDPFEMVTD